MAGGSANDTRVPWPEGSDGWYLFTLGPFNIIASKTNHIVDEITLPFAIRAAFAETISSALAITNAVTLLVRDDTGTPKVLINGAAPAVIVAGATVATELAVVKNVSIFAGAKLRTLYTSGVADTSIDTIIRLWVRPVFSGLPTN